MFHHVADGLPRIVSSHDQTAKALSLTIVPIITIACLMLLIAERIILTRRVRSIACRIHVNGTRGKSSVTRYIGAVLSASQRRTYAKITGIVPTLISPDGSSQAIRRRGTPRVQEQFSVISRAAAGCADAVVLECMSLKPEYQRLEARIFLPHVTVITNIEDDHREEMGVSHEDHVAAISEGIPFHAVVFTADAGHFPLLQHYAEARGTTVHCVPPLAQELAAQLPEGMFAANVALALAVGAHWGISEQFSFDAIRALGAESDCVETTINGFRTRFLNGFAVNDVPSAERYIDRWCDTAAPRKKIIILNTRSDRPLRTVEFVKWCASVNDLHHLFITGTHAAFASRALKKSQLAPAAYSRVTSQELPARIADMLCAETDIVGFGNIAGEGFEIVSYFKNRDAA